MAGRGGFKVQQNLNLQVYRIDYARSLIFVKGSVPGTYGTLVRVKDSVYHDKFKNDELINYPTFVYEKGEEYANIVDMEAPKEDSGENWLHENAIVKDKDDGGDD
jgi:large subunit ribosomal protein L3